jgi:hypothetical protein
VTMVVEMIVEVTVIMIVVVEFGLNLHFRVVG